MQSGARVSTNLMLQSDQATSVLGPIGLCLGGTPTAVAGGLTQGGLPVRLPDPGVLSGSTTYFQSWFRTPGIGRSGASECIAVQFP